MESRPNFVIVMTDTQGANVIGCYGRGNMSTPNADRLAKRGLRCQRAYTSSPVCTPARAGLFTGMASQVAGAWANNLPLGNTTKHMGQRFRDLGYRTGYIGKWHLDGHDYFGDGRCPDGWEDATWYDGSCYLDELSPEQTNVWRQELESESALRSHNIADADTWGGRIAQRAERFLESTTREQSPFLLVVSFDEPHHPFMCPAKYVRQFRDFRYPNGNSSRDDLRNKPAMQRLWAGNALTGSPVEFVRHPLYFGCNSYADHLAGRVIDAVETHAGDTTYIIYTSDHGDMLGAHRLTGKGPFMYEEVMTVPLIISGPGIRAGEVSETPMSHLDILPTMLGLAGEEPPPRLHGTDRSDDWRGHADDSYSDIFMGFNRFAATHDRFGSFFPIRSIVRRSHKLVLNLLDTDEFYDLALDPHELENRITDGTVASVRDEMHQALLAWMDHIRDPFRGPSWAARPWSTIDSQAFYAAGMRRDWPDDGYSPRVRRYETGMPYSEADPQGV